MSLYSIIMAAGEGKRMKSAHAKPLHKAGGRALIDWILDAAKDAGSERNIVVIGHKADEIKDHLDNRAEFAYQKEQLGTGHAVMQGIEPLKECSGTVMVLNGDVPLIKGKTLKAAAREHADSNRAVTVISAMTDDPFGYGRIVRRNGKMVRIVEHKDASEEEKNIKEINVGMYLFDIKKLCSALGRLKNNNAQSEYYITDIVEILIGDNEIADTYIAPIEETAGVNDRIQLAYADELLNARKVSELMSDGVSILNPSSVRIGVNVKVGRDTIIYPGTILEGNTEIGDNCIIGPNSRIIDCKISDNTEIQNSVATTSSIGSNTVVGPFAYIRPNSKIGNNVKIGDFVEIKNAVIDNDTKVAHLTYIGDADVGKRVNFGCGTVVVNYDGICKHRTTIKDDCFIGCNSNLVSPVTLEKGAYTAAGSTITDKVPENALAIARARQVNKEGWVEKNRKKD